MLRKFLLALGVLFAAVGFAITINPSLALVLGFLQLPSNAIAVLAVFFAFAAYIRRRGTTFRDASDDEQRNAHLESRFEAPRPGANVDARSREAAGDARSAFTSQQLKENLRDLARQVLIDARGLSPEEADAQLAAGTWTDDDAAASYFVADANPPAEDFVDSIFGATPMYERQASHVIRELRRMTGVTDGGEPDER